MATEKRNYKRVMLKLSGESLANDKGFGIDPEVVYRLAGEIKEACETGIEVAVVVGGGNIWRGLKAARAAWTEHQLITWACLLPLSTQWLFRMLLKSLASAPAYRPPLK